MTIATKISNKVQTFGKSERMSVIMKHYPNPS